MYEAIREKLLNYIRENRFDLMRDITDDRLLEDLLNELMINTNSEIKQMLSEGINRNKIQWICLDNLITILSRPNILIVKRENKYARLSGTVNLTPEMIELMSIGAYALSQGDQSSFTLN